MDPNINKDAYLNYQKLIRGEGLRWSRVFGHKNATPIQSIPP